MVARAGVRRIAQFIEDGGAAHQQDANGGQQAIGYVLKYKLVDSRGKFANCLNLFVGIYLTFNIVQRGAANKPVFYKNWDAQTKALMDHVSLRL